MSSFSMFQYFEAKKSLNKNPKKWAWLTTCWENSYSLSMGPGIAFEACWLWGPFACWTHISVRCFFRFLPHLCVAAYNCHTWACESCCFKIIESQPDSLRAAQDVVWFWWPFLGPLASDVLFVFSWQGCHPFGCRGVPCIWLCGKPLGVLVKGLPSGPWGTPRIGSREDLWRSTRNSPGRSRWGQSHETATSTFSHGHKGTKWTHRDSNMFTEKGRILWIKYMIKPCLVASLLTCDFSAIDGYVT